MVSTHPEVVTRLSNYEEEPKSTTHTPGESGPRSSGQRFVGYRSPPQTNAAGLPSRTSRIRSLAVHTRSHHRLESLAGNAGNLLRRRREPSHLDTSQRLQQFLIVRGGEHRAMLPLSELDHGQGALFFFGTNHDPVSPCQFLLVW